MERWPRRARLSIVRVVAALLSRNGLAGRGERRYLPFDPDFPLIFSKKIRTLAVHYCPK